MIQRRCTGRDAVAVAAIVLVASCGGDGDTADANPAGSLSSPRTIEVSMVDIAFEPTAVTVGAGETVEFVFTNHGAVRHEAVVGSEAEQEEHADEMLVDRGDADMGDMDMGSADAATHDQVATFAPLVVEPGATASVVVTFDEAVADGTIIGCHEPGHWAAGMRLNVTVEQR